MVGCYLFRPGRHASESYRKMLWMWHDLLRSLLLPKPTSDGDCQRCGLPDLGTTIHWRPLVSVVDDGDGYSLRYSAPAGPSLYHLAARRSLGRCRRPACPFRSAVAGLARRRCCTLLLHSGLRSDQGHPSAYNAEQYGKLVKPPAAQEGPDPGDPLIWAWRHGAEPVQPKGLAVPAYVHVPRQDRSAVFQLDGGGYR